MAADRARVVPVIEGSMFFTYTGFGGWWMGIGMILWWALMIAMVIAIVRWVTGDRNGRRDRVREILEERYARGEISKAEFEEKWKAIADRT